MKNPKIELGFLNLGKALKTLEDVVLEPMRADKMNVDTTIHRFEYTIELFWKLLKVILESKGVEVVYPREVLQNAYQGHLIDDEKAWLGMLRDRNLTSHSYKEELALEIYNNIRLYVPVLRKTFDQLQEKF